MTTTNEPKYKIADGKLVNRVSNEAIPDDEPVFVLRARDRAAIPTLLKYYALTQGQGDHSKAVLIRLQNFQNFANDHCDRMKIADTVLTPDWKS